MNIFVDTSSWIDYFYGNKRGIIVKGYLNNPENKIITGILNLAELSSFLKRKKIDDNQLEKLLNLILSLAKIESLDVESSIRAGKIHARIKKRMRTFGLVDASIVTLAKKTHSKILTSDKHFRHFKETILI